MNASQNSVPTPEQILTDLFLFHHNIPHTLFPSLQETLKSVVAQYNASQLLTMRETVSKEINRQLTARANAFNILVDDVSITGLTFGKEYTQAVEAKQVAQQEAERAKFIVDRASQEKQRSIIAAQGEVSVNWVENFAKKFNFFPENSRHSCKIHRLSEDNLNNYFMCLPFLYYRPLRLD